MSRLVSKVALITGGAQGIGEACVRRFVAEDARVLIGDVKLEKGAALAAELGDSVLFQELDVTSEDQFAVAIAMAVETWGRFDILVNNAAAIFPAAPLEETTNEEFDRLMAVNVRGVFLGCKLAYPHLKQSRGCVVNISSMAGVTGQADHAVYGATKGAVNALTKCAATDWGQDGVRVNSICPACVLTEATFQSCAQQPDPDAALAQLDKIHLLGRAAEPAEIAAAVAFLASDDASFITGCNLPVSGGSECGYNM
jgi:NAD(P)-dependent dehydrogenase (short-subunit alcohol dehydrogenase family)